MAKHRLLESLAQFNRGEISRIFGEEDKLCLPDCDRKSAPVKRVAIFAEAFLPKIDGVSKSVYLTMRYLQQTGREVMVFAPDIAPQQIGVSRIIRLPSFNLSVAPETYVAIPTPQIDRHLKQFRPDLIHLFSPAVLGSGGMIAGRRYNIPVIANYQTDLPGYARKHYGVRFLSSAVDRWLRFIHNNSHMTLVPSNQTLLELRQRGYRRLHLWRRGVDIERFHPRNHSAEWRQRLLNGRDPDSLLCIYVGRLAPEKQVDLLINVAHLPGVSLTIIGDGAERGNLEKLFAGTGTHFMGYLLGDELARAYASGDVFLFPGPNETFGQVVQEAMASGLPGVIVNSGGVVDLIRNGINGFSCDENPAALADAVSRLRDNPALRQNLASASRRFAEAYPWTVIMSQLEEHYQHAMVLSKRLNDRRTYRNPVQQKTTPREALRDSTFPSWN